MASNTFGNIFRITTWGESHGKGIGVVIDGCPAGLALSDDDINQALEKRAPGRNAFTSPRKEKDEASIYSGVFEGKTTGAPISIVILNKDADPSKYEPIKHLMRPGHANFTYLEKYGCFDYRGGGRSSARETACRVAAAAVAKKLLDHYGIQVTACIRQIGQVQANAVSLPSDDLHTRTQSSAIFCPDATAEKKMMFTIEQAKQAGDSLGGIVEFQANNVPVGLGDPVYEKLEANLAKAMMSLPASKGFEMGEGFSAVMMPGSEHNDAFVGVAASHISETNHAGGTLGGITNGMSVIGRVAFKPTSSIAKKQRTVDHQGNEKTFELPKGSRHDPCVAIRAVPVVEAMCQLVLADALLSNRVVRL